MACMVNGCGEEFTKGIHVSFTLGYNMQIREQFIMLCQEHLRAVTETDVSRFSLRGLPA